MLWRGCFATDNALGQHDTASGSCRWGSNTGPLPRTGPRITWSPGFSCPMAANSYACDLLCLRSPVAAILGSDAHTVFQPDGV